MGVPVVSLIGDRHASRVGLSLLSAVGHADWATENTEAYIEKAVELAHDRALRQSLRSSLREDLAKSILSDHLGHAACFETALRLAWREWCTNEG
jgi:predicted O-linked N-acetylglucosamine transferase (SPINDLY family)